MLAKPGDKILVNTPVYCMAIDVLQPMGCTLLQVETDQYGLKPQSLRDIMSQWKPADAKNPDSDIPKFIYINPNGTNPTGASMTLQRKRETYKVSVLLVMWKCFHVLSLCGICDECNFKVPSHLRNDLAV